MRKDLISGFSNMEKKTFSILIVEEDANLRKFLELFLKQEGYLVFTASNGIKAVDEIKKRKFDLIISNHKLLDINGYNLLEALKKLFLEIKIIMITTNRDTITYNKGLDVGHISIFNKDFFLKELKAAIAQVLKIGENEKI